MPSAKELFESVKTNTIVLDAFFPGEAAKLEEETVFKKQQYQERRERRHLDKLVTSIEKRRVLEIIDDLKSPEMFISTSQDAGGAVTNVSKNYFEPILQYDTCYIITVNY